MNLQRYLFKRVEVIDTDNIKYVGYVDDYTTALDNEEGEESIGIITDDKDSFDIELFASEIKSIEVIQP